jgi:hypothetical protein
MKNRSTCRTCGRKLQQNDPQRRIKLKSGWVWRYLGECKQCASDRTVVAKWSRRSRELIIKEIMKHTHNINILKKVLEGGLKKCKK